MKRLGNIYNIIASMDNLTMADSKARKGKLRSYGVRLHDENRDHNIKELHEALVSGTFKTSPYHVYTIFTTKERKIYRLPYYPDRILHHAIMNVLEPVWVSVFTHDSYSCIKGRGIHLAAKKLRKCLRKDPEETAFCLKLDIKKFYPSIDHDILKALVRKKIKDRKLLALLDEIIDSADGIPIGNYLSQYFANLYLSYFDHWIKEVKKVKHYYRYADDMVVLSANKEYLHTLLSEINNYLQQELKLSVKENWQVFPVKSRGIDFVGYVFYHHHILLRKSIKKRFCQKVAQLRKKKVEPQEIQRRTASWYGWAKHCNSVNLLNKIQYESTLRPTTGQTNTRQ